MNSNQKFHLLKLLQLFCFLLFSLCSFGQFKILDITRDNRPIPKVDIELVIGNEKYPRSITRNTNDLIEKGTIYVKNDGVVLTLLTSNGNKLTIPGSSTLKYEITKTKEDYQLIGSKKAENIFIEVIKEFTGSVITSGVKKRLIAATDGTVFSLSLADDHLEVALKDGKLNLNHLIKREIKDENVIGNDSKRALFIKEIKQLTVKDGTYPSPDMDFNSQPLLTDDKEIKKFLQKSLVIQRRALLNMGEFSKRAVKYLDYETSIDKGLLSFEQAIENEELEIDVIIQSAFLFADTYLYNDEKEKSKSWLEVGIHFGEIFYKTKSELLVNNNFSEDNELDKAITKSLMYDLLTANEFSAWGYDIKLKLNGCLESSSENPNTYRSNAKNLIDKIEKN